MGNNTIHLNISSSAKTICDKDVAYVELPLSTGPYGIMHAHAKMFADVITGVGFYRTTEGEVQYFATSGGVMEISENGVVFLARTVELAESIDVGRAKLSEEKAREKLRANTNDQEMKKAYVSLYKSLARQKAYAMSKR